MLKIINKHKLQTGMQLYFILSSDAYSIGHHNEYLRISWTIIFVKILQEISGQKFTRDSEK